MLHWHRTNWTNSHSSHGSGHTSKHRWIRESVCGRDKLYIYIYMWKLLTPMTKKCCMSAELQLRQNRQNKSSVFPHINPCNSELNNVLSLASAAPSASCCLFFSFLRLFFKRSVLTPRCHLTIKSRKTPLTTGDRVRRASCWKRSRQPIIRHDGEASAALLPRWFYLQIKQPCCTETQHSDDFVFLFCFSFFFLKGMLGIIMGNFKNQAQMRLSRTDVLRCSLISTWHGAPAENIPGA